MPQVWVTKQFAESVILSGYDVQKYVTAMCDREFEVKNQLKSSLPSEVREVCRMSFNEKDAALAKLRAASK